MTQDETSALDNTPILYRPAVARRKLGISNSTLIRWEKDGLLSCIKTRGGHRRYSLADILKALQQSKT